ncbi:MAG: carbohydrate binding domain-containing protein [Victivallaceae bacterium]
MFLKSLTASVMLLCATLQATEFSNGGFEKKLYKGLPTSWGGKAILKNGEVKPPGSSLDAAEFKEGKQSLKLELSTEDKVIILNTKLGKVVPEKVYEISFWCRISENCRVAIREDHIMSNGKCNSKLFKNFQIINGPTAWKKFSAKVAAKNGDDQLGVSVFIDKGPGSVWLDGFDIQEYEINAGDEVSFRLTPNFYTQNNIFSLPRLAPLMPYLTCANKAQHKFKNPRVILELPEQIQLLSCGYDSTEYKTAEKFNKNGQPYVRYEYTMGVPKSVMRTPDFSKTTFNSVIPLLFTDAVASEKVYKCFIAYKDDTLTCSPSEFGIRITDKIIQTATPKEFSTGIHCGSSVEYNGDPLKKFMMFYKDCGFNNIFLPETLRAGGITEQGMQRDPAPVYDAAREQGLATYLSTNCLINAYMLRYTRATV